MSSQVRIKYINFVYWGYQFNQAAIYRDLWDGKLSVCCPQLSSHHFLTGKVSQKKTSKKPAPSQQGEGADYWNIHTHYYVQQLTVKGNSMNILSVPTCAGPDWELGQSCRPLQLSISTAGQTFQLIKMQNEINLPSPVASASSSTRVIVSTRYLHTACSNIIRIDCFNWNWITFTQVRNTVCTVVPS